MAEVSCDETQIFPVSLNDYGVFRNLDSCTAIVFVLTDGSLQIGHYVMDYDNIQGSASDFVKKMGNDGKLVGQITQIMCIGSTVRGYGIDWAKIRGSLLQYYKLQEIALIYFETHPVNVFVNPKSQSIKISSEKSGRYLALSFNACKGRIYYEVDVPGS